MRPDMPCSCTTLIDVTAPAPGEAFARGCPEAGHLPAGKGATGGGNQQEERKYHPTFGKRNHNESKLTVQPDYI